MKPISRTIRIIAIILNVVFLAGIVFFLIRLGADPQKFRDWAGFISMFAFSPVTLITIALTFHKKLAILTFILKVIAIIINASFLVILIWVTAIGNVHLKGFAMWLFGLLSYCLPVLNIVAVALTFRNEKATSDTIRV